MLLLVNLTMYAGRRIIEKYFSHVEPYTQPEHVTTVKTSVHYTVHDNVIYMNDTSHIQDI